MYFNEWEVLLVDDESDVLSYSKLVMKNFKVYGLPLKIHTAGSKAEALDLLDNRRPITHLAVAFVDVVMETDTAGLDLCQHIRQNMGNHLTRLYVRTGQPGIAPERDVIDTYDISGYFTKQEVTEDKLYALVKSGVRQYFLSRLSHLANALLGEIIAGSGSRAKIKGNMSAFYERVKEGGSPLQNYWIADNEAIAGLNMDENTALEIRDSLDSLAGTPSSAKGDTFVQDDEYLLIKTAAQRDKAEACLVIKKTFALEQEHVNLIHQISRGLAFAWKNAN